MSKRISYSRPDGGVSIVVPAEGGRLLAAAVVDGRRLSFEPPVFADTLVRVWPSDRVTDAEWAESEDEWLSRVASKDVPAGATDVQVIDETDVPADRTFRDAWRHCPVAKVRIDMPAAREVHKARLRQQRAPVLAALDVEYMRADERGDPAEKARIAARKRALRDITADPRIEAAATPEELKAVALPT